MSGRGRLAFLFAGQGAEEPRMGLAMAAAFPPARELLALAAAETGADLWTLLARGGAQLERTEILQPALIAVELGTVTALRAAGVAPDLVAGHSLGEIAAWSASGAVAAEDAVRLAATRGRLMAEQAALHPGGMLALAGCGPDEVEALVSACASWGGVSLAARNAPSDWTLSGDEVALTEVLRRAPARRLRVCGAWHSEAMRGACVALTEAASRLPRRAATARLVSGATGSIVEVEAEQRVPALLSSQLVSPVLWAEVMRSIRDAGASEVVIVGPARVMRGLVRANVGAELRIHVVSEPRDVAQTAEVLRA